MFQYERLYGVKPIRLLHVKPGPISDPIRCDLVQASLLDRPRYEALSYTWGPNENPGIIICGNTEIAVTKNLHAALLRFRYRHEPRIMWVDAVCINQKNNDEKTEQIALMAEIYTLAQRGLIWLGEEEREDQAALSVLCRLEGLLDSDEVKMRTNCANVRGRSLALQDPTLEAKLRGLLITPGDWLCFCSFLRRSWFTRVWVIQEAVLVANAPLTTIVACGPAEISWAQLAKVTAGIASLNLFFHFGSGTGSLRGLGHITVCLMELLRHSHANSPSRLLLAMLDATRDSGATDPRDKLFSLHGLLGQNETADPLLRPNYNKTCAQVYTDAAMYFLRTSKSLDLLQRIPWTLPQYGGYGGIGNLPSWVPDWSIRHVVPQLPSTSFSAGGAMRAEFRVSGDGKAMSVKGKVLARLNHLMEPDIIQSHQRHSSDEDALSKMRSTWAYKRQWYRCCTSACWGLTGQPMLSDMPAPLIEHKYPTGETLQEAFWRTLVCNVDVQGRKVDAEYERYWRSFHHLLGQEVEALASWPNYEDITTMMCFEEPMSMFSEGRRFFTTFNGYMGWAPQRAQVGDIVCIFKGSPVPFILRETILKTGALPFLVRPFSRYFQLIGDCYIHGFMDGEAATDLDLDWFEIMLL